MTTTIDTTTPKKSYFSLFFGFLIFLMVLAGYVATYWLWQQQQSNAQAVTQGVTQSLKGYESDSQQSLAVAKQADERTVELQAKTLVLEEKIDQAISQQNEMQALLKRLNEAKANTLMSEVESMVTLADQQLKFSGNIKAAKMALEAADLPLAQSGDPAFVDIREALGNDLKTLNDFPTLDLAAISNQLTSLMQLTDTLPLLQDQDGLEDHAQAAVEEKSESKQTIQEKIWEKFQSFIMVEKIDSPAQPLVNIEQKFFLRENIKLRLLTARIALLQRNAEVFKQDLEAVRLWLTQYYDVQHPNAEKVMTLINSLQTTELGVDVPSLQNSMDAIANFQANNH